MKRKENSVLGVSAPAARPTAFAAFCIATALSVPVGVLLWVVDWLWM